LFAQTLVARRQFRECARSICDGINGADLTIAGGRTQVILEPRRRRG
jgi:hypothetical protein